MKRLPTYVKDCQKIGLFGLGLSNIGVAEFLSAYGAYEFILRSDKAVKENTLPQVLKGAVAHVGADAFASPEEDILFLSPSVNRCRADIKRFAEGGVKLSSDAELFFELSDKPIFAVSGSDGKSTTTRLASLLLCGTVRAEECGNCGRSMTQALASDADAYVTELSSFMLDAFIPKSKRAVITSISENHLDFHGSLDAYFEAKENLYRGTREPVIWADKDFSDRFIKKYPPYALLSASHGYKELSRLGAELILTFEDGRILRNGEPLIELSEIKRQESHNIENFMSAMALCDGYYEKEQLLRVAGSFNGIAHRAERICTRDGVEYIDSSVDSSPTRTATTLRGLGKRVILILGGPGKGLSYEPLIKPVCEYAAAVILTGENAAEIKRALLSGGGFQGSAISLYECENLASAVRCAKDISVMGDTVLLSPASTSYDEFKNFEERADFFKKLI